MCLMLHLYVSRSTMLAAERCGIAQQDHTTRLNHGRPILCRCRRRYCRCITAGSVVSSIQEPTTANGRRTPRRRPATGCIDWWSILRVSAASTYYAACVRRLPTCERTHMQVRSHNRLPTPAGATSGRPRPVHPSPPSASLHPPPPLLTLLKGTRQVVLHVRSHMKLGTRRGRTMPSPSPCALPAAGRPTPMSKLLPAARCLSLAARRPPTTPATACHLSLPSSQ